MESQRAQGDESAVGDRKRVEIGLGLVGLTHVSDEDSASLTAFGIPNPTSIITPSAYVSIFLTPQLAIEPQLGFVYLSEDDDGDSDSTHTLSGTSPPSSPTGLSETRSARAKRSAP